MTARQILLGKGLACATAIVTLIGGLTVVATVGFGVRADFYALLALAALAASACFTGIMMLIASLGTTHFKVWKEDHQGKTRALIARLDDEGERIEEIARMLGGQAVTESARVHARELLSSGSESRPRKRRAAAPVSKV
jgi:DNA repair protein RecN (Recombination protein N)